MRYSALLRATLLLLASWSSARALDNKTLQCMVMVEGEHGRGSAFTVRMGDHVYLISNSHVIQGQSQLTFKNLSNQTLQPGPLQIAASADLVRAELAGSPPALEVVHAVEQSVRIGDEVVVAGNSEGEGVVREIPGKVVGLGPDRVEVDAPFVPGNSGSPILLKSTGQVIGVATYMIIPRALRATGKADAGKDQNATELGEVRRFGYRLDTVSQWVEPRTPDRLLREGRKLREVAETLAIVRAMIRSGPDLVARSGQSRFLNKKLMTEHPTLAPLGPALDRFSTQFKAAQTPDEKQQAYLAVFQAIKEATTAEVTGFQPNNFSGYYSTLFKEELDHLNDLNSWLDDGAVSYWTNYAPFGFTIVTTSRIEDNRPQKADPKMKLVLSAHTDTKGRHRVGFPVDSKPHDLQGLYWIIEDPDHSVEILPVRLSYYRFESPKKGVYKVHVDYRLDNIKTTVSNQVEMKVDDH